MSRTLSEMLAYNVANYPEKTALIHKDCRLTYKNLYEQVRAVANFLIESGLQKGQTVGLLLQKTPEAIVAFLGGTHAGGIVFPIADNSTIEYIQALLDLTNPFALIVAEDFQALLSQLHLPCKDERIIVIGQKANDSYQEWADVLNRPGRNKHDIRIQADDVAYFNITSGTTGLPKCAITTHDNMYWNTLASVETLGLTYDDVHLCMFPIFGHPHELFARPLYLGGTIVLLDNIKPKSIVAALQEYQVTCLMAVASIYNTLVRLYNSSAFTLPSLRLAESGGMHFSPTLAREFQERFGIPVTTVWGSTETTGIALATPRDENYRPGSMGKPCAYYEVKIVDENGQELPPGEIGEMVIRGNGVCAGYFGSPEQTHASMRDGWLFTGDLVKKDQEGYYYFASRKTGMMKVAGMKVYPTEIEDILSMHPKILEVAVVKGLDGIHGEVPKAVIVPKEGVDLDNREVRDYCEQRIARYKVPRIIEFRTHLPKTSTGKVLKQLL